jgi:peptidoglycan/xylan/chitin deacetylase (PgdA/CDA1 family)
MPTITLSFDNGPDPEVTPQVLDVLRRAGIRATFFVLGRKLAEHRALSAQARAEGHWIGNHTFSHEVPLGESDYAGVAEAEIGRTQALLGDLADERRLFRPFGGGGNLDRRLLNRESFDYLVAGRYTCVLWNSIPRDWAEPDQWVERALAQCCALEHALVVLHDLPTGAMRHLDRFIDEARDRGATFAQEFPADCVPLLRGERVHPMEPYVAGFGCESEV